MSKIEWTEKTWNPIVGCSIVSPGCTNCYAMKMAARLEAMNVQHYAGTTEPSKAGAVWTGKVALAPDNVLSAPLRRRKPTMYFVNSMGDLFHKDIPDDWIDRVFAVMALSPQHTFQVLTKRSARMRDYLCKLTHGPASRWESFLSRRLPDDRMVCDALVAAHGTLVEWPLPNVWLGVSAERQQEANERIPDLFATPAAVRFVSAEPLLGPINFMQIAGTQAYRDLYGIEKLDWIIVGGESGPGARPMHPDWARSIRDQCNTAGVPFFFKQWGAWVPEYPYPVSSEAGTLTRMTCVSSTDRKHVGRVSYLAGSGDGKPSTPLRAVGKSRAGRLLDGREWSEMPETTA